jgi:glycosyltransferase involved in cell wall biosynthesis
MLIDDSRFFFIIVGDGYLKEELTEISKTWKNILFLPKIRKNQIQDLLQNFDICFVGRNDSPLFKHGVSANKYFDYMLAGKPILDSNNYIKDPVEISGCGLIVKPDSAEAIRDGILYLHGLTEDERKKLGKLGKSYIESNHSISKLARDYEILFN